MMSLFPQLLDYRELAPFILRIAAAILIISFSCPKLKKPLVFSNLIIGIAELITGILLVIGLFTQLAALLIIALAIFGAVRPDPAKNFKLSFLLVAVAIALMFLGPGFFSLDLPL